MRFELAGETIELRPDRTAYWPAAKTLLAADLHWGKTETFQAHAVAVPSGLLEDELSRLTRALEDTGARRLLLLGDLIHAREGMSPSVVERVRDWRIGYDGQVKLVMGNHDRRASSLLRALGGPIPLPAGQYRIDISLASPSNPCSNPPVITATVNLGANENATIIAHLAADGTLTASKFSNDLSLPLFLHGRIVAHHTAAAPAVDIKLRRRGALNLTADINGATNGAQAAVDVFIGVWEGNVFPAGTHAAPVLGPIAGLVGYREAYFVYVVGSLQNGTLDKIVLPISF